MKVIDPHFEILEDLDLQSLAVRIEACGRICYKSEDKISPESAEPFIRNIIKHGHNSVTEMAVLTLRIRYDSESFASQIFYLVPKFLHIDKVEKKELLVTGSVRAFRELYQANPSVKMVKAIAEFLGRHHPLFYEDLLPTRPEDWLSRRVSRSKRLRWKLLRLYRQIFWPSIVTLQSSLS